jgi:hypothetical protein
VGSARGEAPLRASSRRGGGRARPAPLVVTLPPLLSSQLPLHFSSELTAPLNPLHTPQAHTKGGVCALAGHPLAPLLATGTTAQVGGVQGAVGGGGRMMRWRAASATLRRWGGRGCGRRMRRMCLAPHLSSGDVRVAWRALGRSMAAALTRSQPHPQVVKIWTDDGDVVATLRPGNASGAPPPARPQPPPPRPVPGHARAADRRRGLSYRPSLPTCLPTYLSPYQPRPSNPPSPCCLAACFVCATTAPLGCVYCSGLFLALTALFPPPALVPSRPAGAWPRDAHHGDGLPPVPARAGRRGRRPLHSVRPVRRRSG